MCNEMGIDSKLVFPIRTYRAYENHSVMLPPAQTPIPRKSLNIQPRRHSQYAYPSLSIRKAFEVSYYSTLTFLAAVHFSPYNLSRRPTKSQAGPSNCSVTARFLFWYSYSSCGFPQLDFSYKISLILRFGWEVSSAHCWSWYSSSS